MGMLINGKWSTEWYKPDKKGHFIRNDTLFHNTITHNGSSGFKAEPDHATGQVARCPGCGAKLSVWPCLACGIAAERREGAMP